MEAVFLTALIDAHEERNIAIINISGAFMHVDMDELVHVRIDGWLKRSSKIIQISMAHV